MLDGSESAFKGLETELRIYDYVFVRLWVDYRGIGVEGRTGIGNMRPII